MLTAACFASRWVIRHWQVPRTTAIRWTMVIWFLALLFLFETLLGAMLFGRTVTDQWAALAKPAGLLGLAAQIIAALLPLLVSEDEAR